MMRLLGTALLLLLLTLSPRNACPAEELHAIKEKAPTGRLYERALEFFTKKVPEAFQKRLAESTKYIDFIREVFTEKEIPLDIAYLPLIESGFSPVSVGLGDAVGLWQFVRSTGRRYGLKIDRYVDERKDPVKSTHAAARYLKDLYDIFGTWDVALAAYNAGDGKIRSFYRNKSLRLPEIINRYLANFMAASTVAQDPESYGLEAPEDEVDGEAEWREIVTDKVTSLRKIAEVHNTSVEMIRRLNPALLTNYTPPYPYVVRLPDD